MPVPKSLRWEVSSDARLSLETSKFLLYFQAVVILSYSRVQPFIIVFTYTGPIRSKFYLPKGRLVDFNILLLMYVEAEDWSVMQRKRSESSRVLMTLVSAHNDGQCSLESVCYALLE